LKSHEEEGKPRQPDHLKQCLARKKGACIVVEERHAQIGCGKRKNLSSSRHDYLEKYAQRSALKKGVKGAH